jgi:apolipoprotein N-acyltransferase
MGTVGYFIDFSVISLMITCGIVVFGVVILSLIIFLFRNEKWMKSLLGAVKTFFRKLFDSSVRLLHSIDACAYVALPVSILYMLILPKSASLVTMGYIERYFFPGMTIFLVFYIALVVKAVSSINTSSRMNKLLIVFIVGVIVFLNYRSNFYTDIFKFDNFREKEMSAELSGRDVYVVMDNAARDMTWLSSILKDSNMVYVELTEFLNDEDTTFPDLPEDCLVLVNTRGFLQEDEFGNPLAEYDALSMNLSKPHITISTSQFIDELNEKTGRSYTCCDEYRCFIGDVRLYKCNAE